MQVYLVWTEDFDLCGVFSSLKAAEEYIHHPILRVEQVSDEWVAEDQCGFVRGMGRSEIGARFEAENTTPTFRIEEMPVLE